MDLFADDDDDDDVDDEWICSLMMMLMMMSLLKRIKEIQKNTTRLQTYAVFSL